MTAPAPTPKTKTAPKQPISAAAKRRIPKPASLPEDHTASEAVAHSICTEYSDLAPSVNRIMNAGLHEAGQLHAITLFQTSLEMNDDPNRDPRIAIEAGRLVPEPAPAV
jgi:hypothetical protein